MSWGRLPGKPGGAKYGNEKAVVDGMAFDSRREARRWSQLRLLEKAGEISNLERQVDFELIPVQREPDSKGPMGGIIRGHVIEKAVVYRADFVYKDKDGAQVVEDAKGFRTPEYVLKRKLMLYVHGIRIKEV